MFPFLFDYTDYRTPLQIEEDHKFGRKFDIAFSFRNNMASVKKEKIRQLWRIGIFFRIFKWRKEFEKFLGSNHLSYRTEMNIIMNDFNSIEPKELQNRLNQLSNRVNQDWNNFMEHIKGRV